MVVRVWESGFARDWEPGEMIWRVSILADSKAERIERPSWPVEPKRATFMLLLLLSLFSPVVVFCSMSMQGRCISSMRHLSIMIHVYRESLFIHHPSIRRLACVLAAVRCRGR